MPPEILRSRPKIWNRLIISQCETWSVWSRPNASEIHQKKIVEIQICSLAHPLSKADEPAHITVQFLWPDTSSSIFNIKHGNEASNYLIILVKLVIIPLSACIGVKNFTSDFFTTCAHEVTSHYSVLLVHQYVITELFRFILVLWFIQNVVLDIESNSSESLRIL